MCLRTRRRVSSCALAIAAFLGLAGAPSAHAQGESTMERIVFGGFNPCTGESIVFEGRVHNVARGELTGPHGITGSLQGTGVSDTGVHYVWISVGSTQLTFPEGEPGFPPPPERAGADIETSVSRVLIIRQGTGPSGDDDFSFFGLMHITETPDGEIMAIWLTVDDHCQ